MSRSKLFMIITLCLFVAGIMHAVFSEVSWATSSHYSKTFIEAFGYMGIARTSECLSVRNPILEPVCLPDIPGGYCYHESCGMIGPTYVGQECTIEVNSP